jgi:tetratricopeptide (TPR) repeat protein
MKRVLLSLLLLLMTLPAVAAYVVAPDVVREYVELRDKIQKSPDDAGLNFEYAICLSYLGNVEEGRTVLKRVRALDSRFAQKALPRYLMQHRANPNDAKVKYRLGFLYYFNEQYDQALRILEEVAERKPPDQLSAWALGYMAVVKGKQKKWEEAESLVRRALAIEPEAYGLHAALAAALKGQGKYFAATRAYMTAVDERETLREYLRTLPPPK